MPKSPALRYLWNRLAAKDPKFLSMLEEEQLNAEIAQAVYDLRTAAGVSQRQLAGRVGTQPRVISRIEDADYRGLSLTMLRKIAAAFGRKVEIRFVRASQRPKPARIGRR
ncbi:MAG: XRE family transcriptional regulator [Planctomycetes bacterium]|nr:XRE family transcriptional regulator [Planctomycetota bacterium]